jgi:hypothetical protein
MAHLWNRRAAAASALLLALAFSACNRKQTVEQGDEQGPPQMSSMVHTADPKSEIQLVKGFYGIEENSWRWTAQQFSVKLKPPAGAAQKGATLNLQLAVPDRAISQFKSVTLSGSAGAAAMPPETYNQAGRFTYTRDVPADQLTGDAVQVDFKLDKALPPSGGDLRALGLIVSSISLDPK